MSDFCTCGGNVDFCCIISFGLQKISSKVLHERWFQGYSFGYLILLSNIQCEAEQFKMFSSLCVCLCWQKWKHSVKSDYGMKVSKSLFSAGKEFWCIQSLPYYFRLFCTPAKTAAGQAMVNNFQSMQKPQSLQFFTLVNSFPLPLPVVCLWSWILQKLCSLNGTDFGKPKRNRKILNTVPQIFESISFRPQPSSARRASPQGWASFALRTQEGGEISVDDF